MLQNRKWLLIGLLCVAALDAWNQVIPPGLLTASNWTVATYTIRDPATRTWGGGLELLAHVAQPLGFELRSGVGLDLMQGGAVTVPSAQAEASYPLTLGGHAATATAPASGPWLTLRPFLILGAATPVGGTSTTAQPLLVAGLSLTLYKRLHLFGAMEERTGHPGPLWLAGITL